MEFDFNKAIEIALRTWYPKDHYFHNESRHPLGKLLGEWGELLDDYMKSLYKPKYQFNPENELGDIWYYLRILYYQIECVPSSLLFSKYSISGSNDFLIACAMEKAAILFRVVCSSNGLLNYKDCEETLNISYVILLEICKRYDISLQQLTESNWQKLKPGSERGEEWRNQNVGH